jgi:membrane protein required for colicin V production
MPAIDWIFIAVLVVSLLMGAWRGLVYEVLSLVNWVAAFVLAQLFAPWAAQWLPMTSASETVRYAAGFVVVLVACVFIGGLIAMLLSKLVSAIGLGGVDRLLGSAFGLVRGAVILLAVTVVMGMVPLHTAVWWQEATGPKVATSVLHGIKPVLPEEFGKYLP